MKRSVIVLAVETRIFQLQMAYRNPEDNKAYCKAYWAVHKEKYMLQKNERWKNDPEFRERSKLQKKIWYAKNKDKVKQYSKQSGYYKLRFDVLNRDNFTCKYCGKSAPSVKLEVDHIVPRSKGGKSTIENLTTSCSDCNQGKSDMLINQVLLITK